MGIDALYVIVRKNVDRLYRIICCNDDKLVSWMALSLQFYDGAVCTQWKHIYSICVSMYLYSEINYS